MKHAFATLVLVVIFFSGYSQNPLFIPPIIEENKVNLHVKNGSMQFLTGGETATMGINGSFLGPTVILNQGDSVFNCRCSKSSVTRIITLSTSGMGMGNLSGPFLINGKSFSMERIDFSAKMGATEIWQISNQTAIAHPFHIHGLQFFITDIGGIQPDRSRQGRKDVVLVPAMQSVRLIMKFDDFSDPLIPYMFHCHMLSHEDDGMMGQFLVTEIPMGMSTLGEDPVIRIYPNPVTDRLTIEASGVDRSPVTIEITNSLGQIYFQEKISRFPTTLIISHLNLVSTRSVSNMKTIY